LTGIISEAFEKDGKKDKKPSSFSLYERETSIPERAACEEGRSPSFIISPSPARGRGLRGWGETKRE
jgi:hypothetical protein